MMGRRLGGRGEARIFGRDHCSRDEGIGVFLCLPFLPLCGQYENVMPTHKEEME